MNVLYVYDGHWPHNATRVSKQINCLMAAGHHVTILSRARRGQATWERDGSLTAVRIPCLRSSTLDRLATYPVFLNPVWLRQIWRHARLSGADSIIVRDLPLAPAALFVGARLGLPVFYDMAEVYPIALRSLYPGETGFAKKLASATHAADLVERWALRRARATFVVSEESRRRCIALGVPADRVVLVGNTPANADVLRADLPRPDDVADLEGRPTALFVGNIFTDRGLACAIDAMAIVAREIPEAMLVVVGEGRERPLLEEQAARLGLGGHVRFLGWKHHREHAAYLRNSQVGLLPFLATEHINITLANKLFDYMAAGLPVVASDVPPMRRIIEETGSGLLAAPGDSVELANMLVRLFRSPSLRADFAAKGQAAIAGPYAWENDARRFIQAIDGVVGAPVDTDHAVLSESARR